VIKKIERNLAPLIIVITSQRIRELDHIMRKGVNERIKMTIKWKSQKRKPLVRPRKKSFLYLVKENIGENQLARNGLRCVLI